MQPLPPTSSERRESFYQAYLKVNPNMKTDLVEQYQSIDKTGDIVSQVLNLLFPQNKKLRAEACPLLDCKAAKDSFRGNTKCMDKLIGKLAASTFCPTAVKTRKLERQQLLSALEEWKTTWTTTTPGEDPIEKIIEAFDNRAEELDLECINAYEDARKIKQQFQALTRKAKEAEARTFGRENFYQAYLNISSEIKTHLMEQYQSIDKTGAIISPVLKLLFPQNEELQEKARPFLAHKNVKDWCNKNTASMDKLIGKVAGSKFCTTEHKTDRQELLYALKRWEGTWNREAKEASKKHSREDDSTDDEQSAKRFRSSP
jgi:hypothetical protein